jgi:5-(carboxyamino)imidazole ribonucleotide synthase
MSQRIGIIGCGQLAQMLAEAARRLGLESAFLCANEVPVVEGLGRIYAMEEVDAFVDACDAITVEREDVPYETLHKAERVGLYPGFKALETLRHRHTQKALLDELAIATSPWRQAADEDELKAVFEALGDVALRCKTSIGGYDGGGQWRVKSAADIDAIPATGYPLIAEAEVTIEREFAVLVARSRSGETLCYPLTENIMRDGILTCCHMPALAEQGVESKAQAVAQKLVDALDYVGVLAIEFFQSDDQLLVNELAPRVHNTGHWSLNACRCDQFEQHIRAVAGLELVAPAPTQAAAMVNLLGEQLPASMPDYPLRVMMQTYGKGIRPGRKLGHLTVLGEESVAVREAAHAMLAELEEHHLGD